MMGKKMLDPDGVESQSRETAGLGLLDVETIFQTEKKLCQAEAVHISSGLRVRGYEIHMGTTERASGSLPAFDVLQRRSSKDWPRDDGTVSHEGNVWGTYLHGVFDDDRFRRHFIDSIRIKKGMTPLNEIVSRYDTDTEYDKLAALLREHLDIEAIYRLLD